MVHSAQYANLNDRLSRWPFRKPYEPIGVQQFIDTINCLLRRNSFRNENDFTLHHDMRL